VNGFIYLLLFLATGVKLLPNSSPNPYLTLTVNLVSLKFRTMN